MNPTERMAVDVKSFAHPDAGGVQAPWCWGQRGRGLLPALEVQLRQRGLAQSREEVGGQGAWSAGKTALSPAAAREMRVGQADVHISSNREVPWPQPRGLRSPVTWALWEVQG